MKTIFSICFFLSASYLSRNINAETEITKLAITSSVTTRFAEVNVSNTMANNAQEGEEIQFEVQMPSTAFITRFSIVVNEEEFLAEIKENTIAQQVYNEAKENKKATGLITRQALVNEDFDFEVFKVQVYIPAEGVVEFHLQYQELLERRLGVYTQWIYIRPKQIVKDIDIVCYFNEPQGFQSFSYQLPTKNAEEVSTEITDFTRMLSYKPSAASQTLENPVFGINGKMTIQYDVTHDDGGGIIFETDDHFTHFFSPECQNDLILSKRIVFIIDKSGSMNSPRIDYVKIALRAILNQLRPTDYFNLVTFDEYIFKWKPFMVEASEENIALAIQYTNAIVAKGSTNINMALIEGIRLFKKKGMAPGDPKSNVIVFLTDGIPTKGTTSTTLIREQVRSENTIGEKQYASIFSVAFGTGTQADFLKRLAWYNGGDYKAIRTGADASELLLNFFEAVQNPYLNDVHFNYNGDSDEILPLTLTQTDFPQYFCGSELVVSGQVVESGQENSSTTDFKPIQMEPRVLGRSNKNIVELEISRRIKSALSESSVFLARLYVYKKIKDLLKQAEVETGIDESLKRELNAQALNLSLTYGFVTKLTSLVVDSVKEKEPSKMAPNVKKGSLTRNIVPGTQQFIDFDIDSTTDVSTPAYMPAYGNGEANLKVSIQTLLFLGSFLIFVVYIK